MKKIIILGGGMVGGAMARDLMNDFDVVVADLDATRLAELKDTLNIDVLEADLSKSDVVRQAIAPADLVIGAVPGFMGFETMRTVIDAGKNIVDISFYPEDPFELDALAKERGVIAIMDCGVAPGISNLSLGYYNTQFKVDGFRCLVGGLPRVRRWPYEYKAPFSPIDVIEEYLRPARYVRDGEEVVMPALSEPELIDFEDIGTLEAFNTDGLRSLIETIPIPDMIEKTMRYPGHIEKMRMLRESGFFSEELMDVKGTQIRPIDVTTALLFPIWKLTPQDEEFTIMRIEVKGVKDDQPIKVQIDMLDRTDPETGLSSMARTTGFPCTGTARLVLDGSYSHIGISPPEYVGAADGCFDKLIAYQRERNVDYQIKILFDSPTKIDYIK
ncbi:saccharopine dehydrogenase NADP-binding domain-containing protein [bacterium]|nr:saccharopine dehydrogenase NADP-binding domain-containing protein [bacterium]